MGSWNFYYNYIIYKTSYIVKSYLYIMVTIVL